VSSYGDRSTWESIPEELQAAPWGLWLYSAEGAKWPVGLRGGSKPVDAHDPDNLTDFESAVGIATERGIGIYIDIRAQDGRVGVDYDDCIRTEEDDGFVPVGGVWVHEAALASVRALGGYVEVSPSGEGLKVLTAGKIPSPVGSTPAPWGSIELYGDRRFWAMTGRRLDV
jgi:primase-polymerase (primpol)-like protein